MKKKLGLLLALLLLLPSMAMAMDAQDIKIGGEVRFRGYEMNNFFTYNDNVKYDRYSTFRLKSSIFASANLGDGVSGYVRFTNQTYGEGVGSGDNMDNKVFVENAFVDVKSLWGVPVDLRLGRQNMMYGSGFVLFDGQSQYASTSLYFDGVKGTFNFCDTAKLDVFYMVDQENERKDSGNVDLTMGGMKPVPPSGQTMNYSNGDDIYLYGAYVTVTEGPLTGGKQEYYAMAKKTQYLGRDIKLFGIRLSDKLDMGLDYSVEYARQYGTAYNIDGMSADQEAIGGKADLGFTFKQFDAMPRIFAQYAYMSGDDPDTDEIETWDSFYGGWPQFGDLLAWKYVNHPANNISAWWAQVGEAAYFNLQLATIGAGCKLGKVAPKISYTKILLADDQGYSSDDEGDYYQFSAGYQYSKALSFAMYYAVIMPGDFWSYQDDAYEFFWEAKVRF